MGASLKEDSSLRDTIRETKFLSQSVTVDVEFEVCLFNRCQLREYAPPDLGEPPR